MPARTKPMMLGCLQNDVHTATKKRIDMSMAGSATPQESKSHPYIMSTCEKNDSGSASATLSVCTRFCDKTFLQMQLATSDESLASTSTAPTPSSIQWDSETKMSAIDPNTTPQIHAPVQKTNGPILPRPTPPPVNEEDMQGLLRDLRTLQPVPSLYQTSESHISQSAAIDDGPRASFNNSSHDGRIHKRMTIICVVLVIGLIVLGVLLLRKTICKNCDAQQVPPQGCPVCPPSEHHATVSPTAPDASPDPTSERRLLSPVDQDEFGGRSIRLQIAWGSKSRTPTDADRLTIFPENNPSKSYNCSARKLFSDGLHKEIQIEVPAGTYAGRSVHQSGDKRLFSIGESRRLIFDDRTMVVSNEEGARDPPLVSLDVCD